MKHQTVGEVSREQLLQRVAALESHQREVDRQLRRWRSSGGLLIIVALLLLPLRHGKAQTSTQTGGVPTVSQQIAALQAAVAKLQSSAVTMDSTGKVAIPGPLVAMQGAMVQAAERDTVDAE